MPQTTATLTLGRGQAEIWPQRVVIQNWVDPNVKIAVFDDTALFHTRLIERVLALESDPVLGKSFPGYVGSAKVYHVDRWNCPEAELIHRRAIEMFKRVLGTKKASVDLSWSNIYRNGDYCMPHSHIRATASIVYFLELGQGTAPEPKASDGVAGRGLFMFADPRLKICCREEPQAMTTPGGPAPRNGMMIMFPGKLVHMVDVYRRTGPRITLSWNLNEDPVPGSPLPV